METTTVESGASTGNGQQIVVKVERFIIDERNYRPNIVGLYIKYMLLRNK